MYNRLQRRRPANGLALDLYSHVKVLFSILLGLGVSHILRGLAWIVQHPKQYRVYWVHLV